MSKEYFISDLHIGDRSDTDEFYHEEAFISLLEKIITEKDSQLIILGDFLELWESRLEKVLFYYSNLFSKLFELAAMDNLIYVYGNHDYLPFSKFTGDRFGNIKVKEEYIDEENGIWALHGHQFDDINRIERKEKIKESLGEACFTEELLEIQSHKIPRDEEGNKKLGRYRRGVYKGLQRKKLDCGIIGHTHTEEVIALPDNKTYANPGSWTDQEEEPHYILVENGEIELKSVLEI